MREKLDFKVPYCQKFSKSRNEIGRKSKLFQAQFCTKAILLRTFVRSFFVIRIQTDIEIIMSENYFSTRFKHF